VEAQIAKEIGASRTPVREAMHLLEKDGFLESIPRVGYRVKKLEWEELEEIVEIRRINELLACRWAIKVIDAKTIKALEKNLNMSKAAIDKGHLEDFLKHDEEFHEILVGAGKRPHIFALCQQLRRLMLRYRYESLRDQESVEKALKGHECILDCLKKKDEKCLETAMIDHLDFSLANIRLHTISDAG
jgi:DNA-binding GntR family transcriptional regulator